MASLRLVEHRIRWQIPTISSVPIPEPKLSKALAPFEGFYEKPRGGKAFV
jgi:hypothetical protein